MYLDLIKGYRVTIGGYNAPLKEHRGNTAHIGSPYHAERDLVTTEKFLVVPISSAMSSKCSHKPMKQAYVIQASNQNLLKIDTNKQEINQAFPLTRGWVLGIRLFNV